MRASLVKAPTFCFYSHRFFLAPYQFFLVSLILSISLQVAFFIFPSTLVFMRNVFTFPFRNIYHISSKVFIFLCWLILLQFRSVPAKTVTLFDSISFLFLYGIWYLLHLWYYAGIDIALKFHTRPTRIARYKFDLVLLLTIECRSTWPNSSFRYWKRKNKNVWQIYK